MNLISMHMKQVQDVCLIGQAEKQCRFLAKNEEDQYVCLKNRSEMKDILNGEVSSYKFLHPGEKSNVASGDNCDGYWTGHK